MTDDVTTNAEIVADLIRGITNKRWLKYNRMLDANLEEINSNQVLLMVVSANEKHFQSCGQDGIDRFLEMTLEETYAFLGLISEDDESASEPVAV